MGVLTDFFRATEAELRAFYPHWKIPLAIPIRQVGANPFRPGESIERLCWDPNPEELVDEDGEPGSPSPSIDMKGLPDLSVETLLSTLCDFSKEERERFRGGALIGPEEGPWVRLMPPPAVRRLASLEEAELERVAALWGERSRADLPTDRWDRHDSAYWLDTLRTLVSFARAAASEGRHMYMWLSL